MKARPLQIAHVCEKIKECIEQGSYLFSEHAIMRKDERKITLPNILFVLKNGYHEKNKSTFDEVFNTWKYAIRGLTLDGVELRIIIAFSNDGMLVITVIRIER